MTNNFLKKSAIVFLFCIFLAGTVILAAQAQTGGSANPPATDVFTQGIVPCKGIDCSACDIFTLILNLLSVVWRGAALIGTFMFMYAGFYFLKNDPGKGRKIMTATVVGICIAFGAWLGIDTFIKLLANQDFGSGKAAEIVKYGPWNKINCREW